MYEKCICITSKHCSLHSWSVISSRRWDCTDGRRAGSGKEQYHMYCRLKELYKEYWSNEKYPLCVRCAKSYACYIGHVYPASSGGMFKIKNLRLTCLECEDITGGSVLKIHPKMLKFHLWMKKQKL